MESDDPPDRVLTSTLSSVTLSLLPFKSCQPHFIDEVKARRGSRGGLERLPACRAEAAERLSCLGSHTVVSPLFLQTSVY